MKENMAFALRAFSMSSCGRAGAHIGLMPTSIFSPSLIRSVLDIDIRRIYITPLGDELVAPCGHYSLIIGNHDAANQMTARIVKADTPANGPCRHLYLLSQW